MSEGARRISEGARPKTMVAWAVEMTITFGFVGNRPDVGHLIATSEADRLSLARTGESQIAWGIGFFQSDEVLLRRRPADPRDQVSLAGEMAEIRAHALLAQVRHVHHGELTTEGTPPLRFGHLLFACSDLPGEPLSLKRRVLENMPAFLHPTVGSGTPPELLLGLFLSALPHAQLERSRDVRASRGALASELIGNALRSALERIDQLLGEQGAPAFDGDVWVCSGEHLVVAHRTGVLHLRVFRSRHELQALGGVDLEGRAAGADLAYAVGVLSAPGTPGPGWERLPDQTLLTVGRGGPPETASLLLADAPSSTRTER
jgi:hypothetical protein